MPIKVAFARLSASRLYDQGVPLPLQMTPLLDYLQRVMQVEGQQALGFHIDLLQAIDGMWREKVISRMS